ncbi:MAG: sulfite exporter TauE/SafE family protein [Candidatus Zixiibacteriota bacterium]|nr:MAG: sulfite exporter TauE/SafE family protein [candidate division Zixibacteria bacterium]
MPGLENFLVLGFNEAIQVVLLGFIGGVLSGFIGSGGAFFMTPGMMNLGVPGVIAVGSNITHKFGKALMGSRRHGELGHVDKKLGLFMLITALIGIRVAVWLNATLFHMKGDGHGAESGSAAGDLYISAIFVFVLSIVSISILGDAIRTREKGEGPSTKLAEFFSRIKIPPMILFKTADVKLSFWIIAVVGLFTGYLAGTIGVGGFIGVPAMIYIFGIPTAVAAGTELYLAMFMGAWGAINYAWGGFVDIRLVFLLYCGSLTGIYIGAYGTKVVKERIIRLVTGIIILLCVISRGVNIPVYLNQLGFIDMTGNTDIALNTISKAILFASGISGVIVILYSVFRAYSKRRKVQEVLRSIGA